MRGFVYQYLRLRVMSSFATYPVVCPEKKETPSDDYGGQFWNRKNCTTPRISSNPTGFHMLELSDFDGQSNPMLSKESVK